MVSIYKTEKLFKTFAYKPMQKFIERPQIIEIQPSKIKYNSVDYAKIEPKKLPNFSAKEMVHKSHINDIKQETSSLSRETDFSPLEKDMMKEIKSGKIETAKVIDKNGNLVNDIEFIGDRYSVRISPECIFRDGVMDKFIDATYIHNHPFNAHLSSNDIYQMAMQKIKKMVACTSDGGYSLMRRLKPISEMNYNEFVNAAGRLNSEEIQQMKYLGKKRGLTDIQRMELLNKWRCKRFNDFAQEFGLEFKNNISPLKNTDSLEGNLFGLNFFEKIIDSLIIKFKS